MIHVRGAGLLKDMIDLFRGLRSRYIILYDVNRMWLLLEACAKTLKIVVLDPADLCGERLSPEGMQLS